MILLVSLSLSPSLSLSHIKTNRRQVDAIWSKTWLHDKSHCIHYVVRNKVLSFNIHCVVKQVNAT